MYWTRTLQLFQTCHFYCLSHLQRGTRGVAGWFACLHQLHSPLNNCSNCKHLLNFEDILSPAPNTELDSVSPRKANPQSYQNKPKTIKKMGIGTYISINALNVNGLNAPTKRHRLAEWTQKQDPYICCLQETHFRPRDTYRLKVRGWKKVFHANRNQKKAWSSNTHIR